jgi:crotonobetaine/carnitine-CoA ligase
MIPKFSASAYGEQLVKYDITFCPMNSTNVKMVLNNPETPYDQKNRAWRMMQGLSLVPEHVIEFEKRFNTRLIATYGLTECLGISVADDAFGPRHIGSSGRPQRGYTIRVVDDAGNDVPIGEPGEILVHNEHKHGITQGYYKDPEKTRETFRDGWIHSGDVVFLDKEGYVWFVERKKDMIKRSGFNVAAAEVERAIQMVPGVKEVAVVATPDAVREEAIVAFIVADPAGSVTEEAVMETCKQELAEYKIPQFIEFLDAMPLNFLGKLERKLLRERALKFRIDSYERTPLGSRQRD